MVSQRELNGHDLVGFTKNYAGQTIMAGSEPFLVALPVSFFKSSTVNLSVLGFAVAIFALSLVFWPVSAMLRRHYGHTAQLTPTYRRLRLLVRLACVISLLFVALWVQFFGGVQGDIGRLNSSADTTLRLLQFLGAIGVLGSIAAIYYAVRSWSDRSLWVWSKVWNTLLAVAFVGYTRFLLNWHVLNAGLRY